MIRIFLLLLSVVSTGLSINGYAQIKDVDSLGTLWVITIDKSGSMLWAGSNSSTYQSSQRFIIAQSIASRLASGKLLNRVNFATDRFLLFNSGILNTNDFSQLRFQPRFDTSFIHHTDAMLHSFHTPRELIDRVKVLMEQNDYTYRCSFVSQIRLFSLIKALDLIKDRQATAVFNHIKIVTITDDADQSDQWMSDYKTVSKYAPDKISEVNLLCTKYLFNPFNTNSDISRSGTFRETYVDEHTIPHLICYDYSTTQSSPRKASVNALLSVKALSAQAIKFVVGKEYDHDSLLFLYLDTLIVNNRKYPVNKRIYDTATLYATLNNNVADNDVQVNGYFQSLYVDSIWGRHYRKYSFVHSYQLPTVAKAAYRKYGWWLLGIIVLLVLLYRTVILANKKYLRIYDSNGNKLVIKRGPLGVGKHERWKTGENIIAAYTQEELKLITLKNSSISVHQGTAYNSGPPALVVKSRRRLSIHDPSAMKQEEFHPVQDIESYYKIRAYNELLKGVYRKSLSYKALKFLKRMRLKGGLTNWLWQRNYYYLFVVQPDRMENTALSFSCPQYRNKSFTVELTARQKSEQYTANKRRIIGCLNDFYGEEKNYANALIIVNILNKRIGWNVIKPMYEGSLYQLLEVYHFSESLENEKMSGNTINANIKELKKQAARSNLDTGKIKIYITLPDESATEITGLLPEIKKLTVSTLYTANDYNFQFRKNTFCSFIYLIDTKDIHNRRVIPLFSPFKNGLEHSIFTRIPSTGEDDYRMHQCFLPGYARNNQANQYNLVLADNLFSFSTARDIKLTIDTGRQCILYANHTININNIGHE